MSAKILVPRAEVEADSEGFIFRDYSGVVWIGRSKHYHLDGEKLTFGGEVTTGPTGSEGRTIEVVGYEHLVHMTADLR